MKYPQCTKWFKAHAIIYVKGRGMVASMDHLDKLRREKIKRDGIEYEIKFDVSGKKIALFETQNLLI